MGTALASITWHLLNRQLSTEVRTSLTRFRCTEGVVDDAMHFIFECTATSSIRQQAEFVMIFQDICTRQDLNSALNSQLLWPVTFNHHLPILAGAHGKHVAPVGQ
ncbi:hypothetical protein HaLaN_17588, partial [Haematococcus lacustris]